MKMLVAAMNAADLVTELRNKIRGGENVTAVVEFTFQNKRTMSGAYNRLLISFFDRPQDGLLNTERTISPDKEEISFEIGGVRFRFVCYCHSD